MKTARIEKKFNFGKIDYNGTGRRINAVQLEICKQFNEAGKMIFSASAAVWNSTHTDWITGGQGIERLAADFPELAKNATYSEILDLWKKYHLNDMHAGTVKQENLVNRWLARGHRYDYTEICRVLNLCGLLCDNGYKYGSAWLFREIPAADVARIEKLFNN